jgi:hypothetical protein
MTADPSNFTDAAAKRVVVRLAPSQTLFEQGGLGHVNKQPEKGRLDSLIGMCPVLDRKIMSLSGSWSGSTSRKKEWALFGSMPAGGGFVGGGTWPMTML